MDDKELGQNRLPRLKTGPMRVVGKTGEGKIREPWNARQWLKEKAGVNPGGSNRSGKKPPSTMNTITVQAMICGMVIVVVLVLKAVDLPQTTEVLAGLDAALTSQSDIDKALGKLKFVGDFFADSTPVFSPEEQGFVPPVKDMVINIEVGDSVTPVLAAADGQVFFAGDSKDYGTLMILRHQDGYETWYGGITPEVKTGHTVLAGERIGSIHNKTLKFMAYRDGVALDPRPYLRKQGD